MGKVQRCGYISNQRSNLEGQRHQPFDNTFFNAITQHDMTDSTIQQPLTDHARVLFTL